MTSHDLRARATAPLRVLCTTQPGVGHLLPMAGMLQQLVRRGHRVSVATSPSLSTLCHDLGFEHECVGPAFSVGEEERMVPALARARRDGDREFRYTRTVLVEALGHATLPDTEAVVDQLRPDILVRDPVEFAGLAVAAARGIPHVTGRENRFLSEAQWAEELGDSLARLGGACGAPWLGPADLYPQLGLAPALPSWVTAPADLPDAREFGCHVGPRLRFIRPEAPHVPGSPGPTPRRGRRLVLVTFGSVYREAPALRRAVVGMNRDSHFDMIGDGVGGGRWHDFDAILPRCAAVVTVGGFGTVMAALRHGVPLVMVPLGADHPTNAVRCTTLGVGRVLDAATVTAATLTRSVMEVIDDPIFRRRARTLADEWHRLPDSSWAADQVEAIATQGRA